MYNRYPATELRPLALLRKSTRLHWAGNVKILQKRIGQKSKVIKLIVVLSQNFLMFFIGESRRRFLNA